MTRSADDFVAIRARMRELDGSAQPSPEPVSWSFQPVSVSHVYTGPTIDFLSVDFAPHADDEWTAKKS